MYASVKAQQSPYESHKGNGQNNSWTFSLIWIHTKCSLLTHTTSFQCGGNLSCSSTNYQTNKQTWTKTEQSMNLPQWEWYDAFYSEITVSLFVYREEERPLHRGRWPADIAGLLRRPCGKIAEHWPVGVQKPSFSQCICTGQCAPCHTS